MKTKLRFLVKNKQSIIALFVLLVMVFNACRSPVSPPEVNPDDFLTLKGFYVDSGGKFTETDSGRTAFVADDKPDVVIYSDNIESSDYDCVGLTVEDKRLIVFFEKDQNFPNRIVLSDSEGSYNGIFTLYDPVTQTYGLTLEQGGEEETLSNIALSKDIFTQYKDDPELTPSQNLRMRNVYVAMHIYTSLNDFFSSDDIPLARGIDPILKGVFNIIGAAAAVGGTIIAFVAPPLGAVIAIAGILVPFIVDMIDAAEEVKEDRKKVTGISLDKSSVSLNVGEKVTLTPTITPAIAANKAVRWDTDPSSGVVSVSKDGTVTGVGVGTATITVTALDISKGVKEAYCTVDVKNVPVTGVTLNKPSISLVIGSTETLTPTITPSNATNKSVSWVSKNAAVATVSSNGMVFGLSVGTATITVITNDGYKTADCTVTVNPISVNSVSVKSSTSLVEGGTETLSATIMPSNATNQNISWSSSNTAVATVSANGTISAVSAGTATITVTTVDGSKTAVCNITVVAGNVAVTSVSLNKSSASLDVGSAETLTAVIAPSNATNQNITWSSNNTAIATVSSGGIVTAVTPGTATITVVSVDGSKTAVCTVTVNPIYVSSISVKSSTSLVEGSTETLSVAIMPSNATNKNVSWSSSNTAVVTVSASGTISAVSAGSATITITTVDGSKTAVCNVTVVAGSVAVTGISLNKSSASLDVGSVETLTAVIAPSNATNQNISWNSSNTAVAAVSNSGMVTGVNVGMATITVTTVDGSKTAVCTVTVNPIYVSSISVKSSTSLVEGSTETLSVAIMPSNATNKNVTWSSSNTDVAKVSANGTISAVSAGSVIITVKTADGNKTAVCNVTVVAGSVAVIGVSLNKSNANIDVGSAETLITVITPSNATNQNVTWNSSNTAVAAVTEGGKVNGVAPGTATITVTTVDGSKSDSCIVVVPVPVTGVTLNKSSISLPINGIETLSALITPPDAANQNVTWSSNNTDVVKVTDGKVTVVSPGEAIITVTAADMTKGVKSDSCTVNVIANSWIVSDGSTWNGVVTSIKNGGNNKTYTIVVHGDFSIPPSTLGSVQYVEVTLKAPPVGSGKLILGENGNMIRIDNNQKLIIDDVNLTLQGRTDNWTSLLYVAPGGNLEMKNGTITGNISKDSLGSTNGGGVFVIGGVFTMSGGTISGNSGSLGGGVYACGGTFIMSGGTISDNLVGGGVNVGGGTFIMSGGTIEGNKLNNNYNGGGGVSVVEGGKFTMIGGVIKNNTATAVNNDNAWAGGVLIHGAGSTFNKSGSSIISGNKVNVSNGATKYGHDVYYH